MSFLHGVAKLNILTLVIHLPLALFVLSEQVNLIGNARLKALEVTCSQLYHAMLP